MSRPIKHGSVDQSTVVRIVDATDGTPETAVTSGTAGLDLQYRREAAAAVALTESDLAAVDSAHNDGAIKHIGSGYYRVDLPDAAVASGADGVLVFGSVTGMVVIASYHPLVAAAPGDTVSADVAQVNGSAAAAANLATAYAAFETGTAQAGGASSITLRSGASATDDLFNDQAVFITGGTGAGQSNRVTDYAGATKVATVATAWAVQPDNTSVYLVLGRVE